MAGESYSYDQLAAALRELKAEFGTRMSRLEAEVAQTRQVAARAAPEVERAGVGAARSEGGVLLPAGSHQEQLARRKAGLDPFIGGRAAEVERKKAVALESEEAGSLTRVRSALAAESAQRGVAVQSLRQHGALTSEFFQALARGEVTLREVGYQMGVTTAKFGGWLLAGAAVFAAVDALRELGKGAHDTQVGLTQLERFTPNLDRGRATEGFVKTAQELVVPIKDVADAQARFARVFHDQDDSLIAARTSLLAMKLDNISAADSFRYFLGIVQEWHLNAKDLPGVFDQISAAQRRLGARVAETLPALAKSGAAVRATGGDMHTLIALTALAQTTTGQTGNVIGTAFARGASNFYKQPKSEALYRQIGGLDPNKPFTDFLLDAIKRGQTLSGVERVKLSKAIFGPLRGGLLAGLLGQPESLVQNALKVTSADASKGSAKEELKKVVAGVDQEIKGLGIALQGLGAELGRAHLFQPLHTMLDALRQILKLVGGVTHAFADLPVPLQKGVVYAAELYAVLRVLRRFNIGNVLGGAGARAAGTTVTRDAIVAAEAEKNAAIRAGQTAERRVTGLSGLSYEEGSQQAKQLVAQQRAAGRAVIDAEIQLAAADASLADARAQAAAETRGAAIGKGGRGGAGGGAPIIAGGTAREAGQLADEEKQVAARAAEEEGAVKKMMQQGILTQTAIAGTTGAWKLGKGTFKKLGDGLKGLGESMGSMVGPLEFAIGAYLIVTTTVDYIQGEMKKTDDALKKLEAPTTTAAEMEAKARGELSRNPGVFGQLQDWYASAHNFLNGLPLEPGGTIESPHQHRVRIAQQTLNAAEAANAARYGRGQTDQLFRAALGRPGPAVSPLLEGGLLTIGDVRSNLDQRLKGAKTKGDRVAAYDKALDELSKGYAVILGGPKAKGAAAQAEATLLRQRDAAKAGGGTLAQQLAGLDLKGFQARLQADATVMATYYQQFGKLDKGRLPDLTTGLKITRNEFKKHPTIENAQKLQAAVDAIQNVEQGIATRLQDDIEAAKGPGDVGSAIERALNAVKQLPRAYRHKARKDIVQAASQAITQALTDDLSLADTSGQRDAAYARAVAAVGKLPRGRQRNVLLAQVQQQIGQAITSSLDEDIALGQSLGQRQAAYNHALAEISRRLPPGRKRDVLRQQVLDKQYDDYVSALDAQAKVREASQTSAIAADQIEISTVDRELAYARSHHQSDTKILGLQQRRLQAVQQGAQDAIALSDAYSQLAGAGIPSYDTVANANQAHSDAVTHLNTVIAQGSKLGPQYQIQLVQAQANVRKTAQAQAEATAQAAEDIRQANFQFLESLTTDPVQADKLRLRADADAIAFAHTKAERLRAEAQQSKDRQQLVADRLSSREDDIQFELDMHKISNQQAIDMYQSLLRMQNLTKTQRRDILRKIQSLKDAANQEASGFELDVGSIKMPTAYDVRRAIRAGLRGNTTPGAQLSVANRVEVTVNDPAAAHKVFDAIDGAMGTSVAAAARNAGLG